MAKIVVGMSGGVDSSVCAYLLKKEGHEVIGLFMQNWDSDLNDDYADPLKDAEICQAGIDYNDALEVCKKLDIPLYRVNFVQEYWDKVFAKFLKDYQKGLTPNPDVFCNKYIKFNEFLNYACKEFNCDYIAMGHYARIKKVDDKIYLLRGKDKNKDQSYFLEQLTHQQLAKALFPIGDLEKTQVRAIAKKAGLITANKKDSTGICFIGNRKFRDFLNNYIQTKQGYFVDYETKKPLQKHQGMMFYTIGQRHGLNIGGHKDFLPLPWYVVSKDSNKNIVYVSQREDQFYLLSNWCIIKDVNYLGYKDNIIKSAKFRYRSDDVLITKYEWIDNTSIKLYYQAAYALAPGQACVFYQDEICLGGGEIAYVYYNSQPRAEERDE